MQASTDMQPATRAHLGCTCCASACRGTSTQKGSTAAQRTHAACCLAVVGGAVSLQAEAWAHRRAALQPRVFVQPATRLP